MGVLTGKIGIIRFKGQAIGHMQSWEVNENITRGRVRGIGKLNSRENPALSQDNTLTCAFYTLDFKDSGLPAPRRDFNNVDAYETQVALDEQGLQVDLFKEVEDGIDPNTKKIKSKSIPLATIDHAFIENTRVNLNEAQISGTNQTFSYLDPILDESLVPALDS